MGWNFGENVKPSTAGMDVILGTPRGKRGDFDDWQYEAATANGTKHKHLYINEFKG